MGVERALRVALVHPELLAGGAERVMLDAALELEQRGHRVVVFTARRGSQPSFTAFHDGSLEVHELCAWLPRRLLGRARAACTVARTAVVALRARRWRGQFDLILCDQVPHVIPLLRRSLAAPVLYYCHFPDCLLALKTNGLRRLHRPLLDRLEVAGIGAADLVVVNSDFTARAFVKAFPDFPAPPVLHPGIDSAVYEMIRPVEDDGAITFLSIARFERAKNLGLAIDAFAQVRERLPLELSNRLRLILAGSYDSHAHESVTTLRALRKRAAHLNLAGQVDFLLDPDEAACRQLLANCRCLVYTPAAEHFGMAPLEAMAAGRPVIATNKGGPAETVCQGVTGFLESPSPEAFAKIMEMLVRQPELAVRMGEAGRERIRRLFQRDRFGESLEKFAQFAAGRAKLT